MSDLMIEGDCEVVRSMPAPIDDHLFTPSALSAVDTKRDWFGVVVANASIPNGWSRVFQASAPGGWAVVITSHHGSSFGLARLNVVDEEEPEAVGFVPQRRDALPIEGSKLMAERLIHRLGLPITALSDILDVQRKTIYDWMGGSEAKDATAERLRYLVRSFCGEKDGALRIFHRFWNRVLSDGTTLRTVLTATDLNLSDIRRALEELRPAVETALAEGALTKLDSLPPDVSDLLSVHLQVGSR